MYERASYATIAQTLSIDHAEGILAPKQVTIVIGRVCVYVHFRVAVARGWQQCFWRQKANAHNDRNHQARFAFALIARRGKRAIVKCKALL